MKKISKQVDSSSKQREKEIYNKVLIIASIVLFIWLAFGIYSVSKVLIVPKSNKSQEKSITYDSIAKELINGNLFSNDLIYVGYDYGWGMESVNRSNKYYFYIDPDYYEEYKYYWLEGIDESQYKDKYNEGLIDYGDYVFKAININPLNTNSNFGNVILKDNMTYYLVDIYDKAIYYKQISISGIDKSKQTISISSISKCQKDSLSKQYVFHQENDDWIIEEVTS